MKLTPAVGSLFSLMDKPDLIRMFSDDVFSCVSFLKSRPALFGQLFGHFTIDIKTFVKARSFLSSLATTTTIMSLFQILNDFFNDLDSS